MNGDFALLFTVCGDLPVLIVRVLTNRLGQFIVSCGCGEVNSNCALFGLALGVSSQYVGFYYNC